MKKFRVKTMKNIEIEAKNLRKILNFIGKDALIFPIKKKEVD